MKRMFTVIGLVAALAVFGWSEIKLDTLMWLDYEVQMDSNSMAAATNVKSGGAFYIGRVYVNLRGDIGKDPFGNKIKGRLTVDFTKSTPIKYAFFDYSMLSVLGVGDPLVLSAGLLKTYFGNISDWEYPIPVKVSTETYSQIKPTASADAGVSLWGKLLPIEGLTKNLLFYNIQVLNGEGYEKIWKATDTTNADRLAAILHGAIMPIDGISLGASYRSQAANDKGIGEDALALFAQARDLKIGDLEIPVDFWFEYMTQTLTNGKTEKGTNSTLLSFTLGYGLFDKLLTPYVRYDIMTPNNSTDFSVSNTQVLYAGLNIALDKKNLFIKPMFDYYFMEAGKSTGKMDIKLEMEYKFGFSVWQ
jgi:hypothetical protein